MITLKDLAQHVGISVSAVSMALRDHSSIGEETKRKVWAAKEALGYQVKSKPSGNVAFILFDRGFEHPVYARFFQSIGDMALKQEMHPVYLSLESDAFVKDKLPPILKRRNVDGIIVSGVYTEEAHQRLLQLDIPLVALGNYQLGNTPCAACEVDLAGGVRLMVSTLAELGHRRVGLVVSTPPEREYGRQIRDLYLKALQSFNLVSAGIASEEEHIPSPFQEGLALKRAVGALIQQDQPPTALVVEKANIFIYDACEELGLRIPKDISIISLGKANYEMRPPLSVVESDPEEMGRGAFEKLRRLMDDPNTSLTREVFPMKLNAGKSIGTV